MTEQTETTDPAAAAAAVMGRLLGPDGPCELRPEPVLGTELPVFANRHRALHEVLAASVEFGDRTYIATAEDRLTFTEHARRVSSIARSLREDHGVARGDRVAIAAANSPAWIEAFWATVSIGAISVGFNAWWSAAELEYGVEHSRPTLVLADAKRADALAAIDVRVLGLADDLERMATAYPDAELPTADVAEDDPAVILYTSGTSGRPKGATHSHRNLCSVIEYHRLNDHVAAAFGDPVDPRDKGYLLAMPLFHIGSLHNLAVPRLATGSKVAMHLGSFDVDRLMRLVESERVTHWGAVPTMGNRLLEHGDLGGYDTSSLYAFALASAPSSPAFKERLREGLPFATSLVDSYGLTETCTAVAVATPMDLVEAPGTLGRPVAGVQLEVRGADGTALPPGEEGEVCVRSAYNMLGYWENEEATAASIDADRWLRTGDIGSMDAQGRIRLASRRSDLIIRGGENIYPAEIEGALENHPDVSECIVLGVEHQDLGQEVAAVVVPRAADADTVALEAALREYAAAELAYFKVPTHWRFTTEPLPRNATGKVMRAKVTP